MKTTKKIVYATVGLLALGEFGLCPIARAVVPAPDGGYPGGNTAEGQNALLSLTTGGFNTAVGYFSLRSDTTGSFNTAVGAATLFVNNGDNNTATGVGALFSNTASNNTANGAFALFSNTQGIRNNAFGDSALKSHQTGDANNAVGTEALVSDQGGFSNNALGDAALFLNVTGNTNTAVGESALFSTTGNANTALGSLAGGNATTGSGNVYIGASMLGAAGESNQTYIRNVNTTSVSGGNTDTVTVNLTTGLLGHLTSSRRHKEDIKPMDNASEALYRLKPVTFHYKKEIDRNQVLDYGLIAEDVAEIDSNLAVCNRDGQVESVRHNAINAMLLNEFLKEHRKVGKLEAEIARQRKDFQTAVANQQQEIERLAATVKEQAALIQQVSAQIQLNRLAAGTLAENR